MSQISCFFLFSYDILNVTLGTDFTCAVDIIKREMELSGYINKSRVGSLKVKKQKYIRKTNFEHFGILKNSFRVRIWR